MTELFEGETARALALIEDVHGGGAALAPEYPLVFEDEFPGRTLAVGDAGEMHAACAYLERDLVVPSSAGEERVRVGLIGSVATLPGYRGRGLGTRVVIEAEARLQSAGCAAVFLWADEPDFYLRRGYEPVGVEEDVVVPAVVAPRLPAPGNVRGLRRDDVTAVHALYARHPARVERTIEETAALIACPRMDALVRERDGAVVAYALRGRGRDLAEVVHEWGGATDDVLALLRAHLERRFEAVSPGALILMAPASERALLERLEALGCDRTTGILGLGKLLDRDEAARAIAARLGPLGSARAASGQDTDGRVVEGLHVAGPAGECFLDGAATLALLFAPATVRPSVTDLMGSLGLSGAELPLESFLWGLDSI